MVRKILDLIKDTQHCPFTGLDKPEPLKHRAKGSWSRRIDQEHRLVYRVENGVLVIISCRFHIDEWPLSIGWSMQGIDGHGREKQNRASPQP